MKQYKLAIIMPSWNCANEIAEMLDTIIAQKYQDWQLYCVDDHSTDETPFVLQQYAAKDQRIHYIARPRGPKGAQTCRNVGFELSEGAEYVIWSDSDDIVSPCCFEQRVCYMDKHKELDFAIFPAIGFKENISCHSNTVWGFPLYEDTLGAMLSWTLPMVGWTNIYRRSSIVRANHKWDERILSMQDSDFNIQSILKGLKYDYAYKEGAKVDYYYRISYNDNAVSMKLYSKSHFNSHLYLLDKISSSLSEKQLRKYKKTLECYFFKYACMMKNDKESIERFYEIPWINRNKMFHFRLLVWRLCKYRLETKILFPDLISLFEKKQNDWKTRMESQIRTLDLAK